MQIERKGMIKTEVLEIKKQLSKSESVITKLCGCYVDAEKNIKLISKEVFYRLEDEDSFKYEEIFRKTLSGNLGKQLVNIDFPLDAEKEGGAQAFLLKLRDSDLDDDTLLEEFYHKVIACYDYPENYYIILIDLRYDVPGKGSDKIKMEDASEEVFHAILCSICPVKLSKASLSYHEEVGRMENRVRDWVVEAPMTGFLFPSFNDRSTDLHSVLYFSRKPESLKEAFVEEMFGAGCPMPAIEQKETIQNLMQTALGEDCDYEVISTVHEKIVERIEQNASDPNPLVLTKQDMVKIMSDSGASEEAIVAYEKNEEADIEVLAENVVDRKKFEIKRPGIAIKADAEHMQLISTKVIDGKKCLVIVVDDNVEVNGIFVKSV
jgi:hypothetical protein